MATTHQAAAVPNNRKGVVPKDKGKIADRRALGDIGNIVTNRAPAADKKPTLPQVSRPITRRYAAQLLAKAQADAAAANDNKVVVDKPKQKAAVTKPEPKVVIESSPDTTTVTKKKKKNASRKKVNTLTSVLTARSKAACGITERPSIPDIDAADSGDQLAVVDYIDDLYKFYKLAEGSCRPKEYMELQTELNPRMRAIVANWLIEVHHKFELTPEALYLTFHIIDRYLSLENVKRKELQLVGIGAMLIACKYEEIWAPEVSDFISISDNSYSREQILKMEKAILNTLEWSLTIPTPYVFLIRFIKAAMCDKEMEHLVFFLAELALMQYSMVIKYTPSMLAASAVYAAKCTLKKSPLWTDTLTQHTGFTEEQVIDCAKDLVKLHSAAAFDNLKFVYEKYSGGKFGGVALLPPAVGV